MNLSSSEIELSQPAPASNASTPSDTPETSLSKAIPTSRIHYLDNLRAIAMLLGIVLHAALTYAQPSQNFWMLSDREGSSVMDASIWFIHLFRMSLFFLIAGYFAKMMIDKRGTAGFLKNRFLRITLPFLIFWPFLMVAYVLVLGFAMNYVEHLSPILQMVKSAPADTPPPPPSTSHLWFLYYLMMFTLLAAIIHRYQVLPVALIDRMFSSVWALILLPALLVPCVLQAGVPMVAPESFIPHWWALFFFGAFYTAGWCLFTRPAALALIVQKTWWFLTISVVLYVPFYMLLSDPTSPLPPESAWIVYVRSALNAYLSVLLTLACLGLGQRFLNYQSKVMRFLSDASYWTYLIHLPLVMLIQTFLVDKSMSVWIKFLLSFSATILVSLLLYVVFVRYTPIGWMLNGRRKSAS